jgi:hypothetical protein
MDRQRSSIAIEVGGEAAQELVQAAAKAKTNTCGRRLCRRPGRSLCSTPKTRPERQDFDK